MPYWTYFCLNKNCQTTFTIDVENPACPKCTGKKTRWIPGTTGIISGATKKADETVKHLKSVYGDKNWQSPQRDVRAAPRVNPIPIQGKTTNIGVEGMSMPAPVIQQGPWAGRPGFYCGTVPVSGIGSLPAPEKKGKTARLPNIAAATKIEARTKG